MLMIVDGGDDKINIYLEKLVKMDIAIKQRKCKALQKERIGKDFSIACDEQKRLLVICSSAKVCKFASLKSPI